MAITVRDALQIGRLVEAQVLAGESGLDKEIRAVDIIEVPDAAIWFRRDSLLSTTFYALKDNINAQLKMLDDIRACGGAALIIFSPERYISHIDDRLIEKANEMNLPLLQMPDCSYIDVIVPVMSKILDKQVAALEYAREVHSMMTQMILKGKGLQDLLSSLTSLLNKPVLMTDAELLLQEAAVPPDAAPSAPLLLKWRENNDLLPVNEFYPRDILKNLVHQKEPIYHRYQHKGQNYLDYFFPIIAGDTFYGMVIVPELKKELDKEKTIALEAGSMALALDALKEKAIREAEKKSELDFFNELLLGNIRDRNNLISRAQQYGLDATGSYYVMLAEINRESLYQKKGEHHEPVLSIEGIERKLYRLLHYTMEKESLDGVVINTLGSMVLLIRTPGKGKQINSIHYGKEIMHKIRQNIDDRMDGVPIYLAIGDFCKDLDRINAGYLEAWETIDLGKKLYTKGFALTYSEMVPYHMVRHFIASSGNPKMHERIFEPLLRHDWEKGSELVNTLETYIECNFSRTRTAEKLHLHRNSLNYRLQKIEELLGKDIDQIDSFPLMMASISRRLSS